MEKIIYFSTLDEAFDYTIKNNISSKFIYTAANMEEMAEYYKPFAGIEGCKILIYGEWKKDLCGIQNFILSYCIEWNSTHMTAYNRHGDKTRAFRLVDPFDNKGIRGLQPLHSPIPKKIGRPTAKKLNDWTEYLLERRRNDEAQRDKTIARMQEKIKECIHFFPEAKNIEWGKELWKFEKKLNDIVYSLIIYETGEISEKVSLDYPNWNRNINAEYAARLMQNGLQFCQPSATVNQ